MSSGNGDTIRANHERWAAEESRFSMSLETLLAKDGVVAVRIDRLMHQRGYTVTINCALEATAETPGRACYAAYCKWAECTEARKAARIRELQAEIARIQNGGAP